MNGDSLDVYACGAWIHATIREDRGHYLEAVLGDVKTVFELLIQRTNSIGHMSGDFSKVYDGSKASDEPRRGRIQVSSRADHLAA